MVGINSEFALNDAVAQAFAYSKITPKRVFTLSKRKKKFLDTQFQQQQNQLD